MGRVFRRKFRDKKTGAIVLSKQWTIEFYDGNGRQYREPAKTEKKLAAEALLRKREQAVWEGTFFPEKKQRRQMTVDELRKLWVDEHGKKRSLRHDRARLGSAVDFFGEHRMIATLTGDDVVDWKKSLEAKGLATATVNRHLAVLRSALNHAAARGYTHRDPMDGVVMDDELNARNRVCSPEEYAALLAASSGEVRLLVVIGYHNGMRLGEIVGLKRDQVDIKNKAIRLRSDTKEGSAKNAPLPVAAIAEIEALPIRLDGRLFSHHADDYSRRFSEVCAAAKVKGLRFHDLRHTAVTNFLEAGIDLLTIQTITGHKTLHMTKRYAHITDARRREAMSRVEAHAATRDRS